MRFALKKHIDYLTSLYNRRYLEKIYKNHPISRNGNIILYYVAMIDLNNFKRNNQFKSYSIGDSILIRASQYIEMMIKEQFKNAIIFRLGGDEFIIIDEVLNSFTSTSFENALKGICSQIDAEYAIIESSLSYLNIDIDALFKKIQELKNK